MTDTLMQASPRRIQIAANAGLENADAVAIAARAEGVSYAIACALVEQESGGANIYGHDQGGTFSTRDGSVTVAGVTYPQHVNVPVTPVNAAVFLLKIGAGAKSNGMGLCQITWAADLKDGRTGGYFRQMTDDEGLVPWEPVDNARFGLRLLRKNYERVGDWRTAFGHYNGGTVPDMTYAGEAMDKYDAWKARFTA